MWWLSDVVVLQFPSLLIIGRDDLGSATSPGLIQREKVTMFLAG